MSRPAQRFKQIAFVAASTPEAREAYEQLAARYGNTEPTKADVIVALGGDGLMLQTLHKFMNSGKPIYGMHRGTVGFLMNEFVEQDLVERINAAHLTVIHPLVMRARDCARPHARASRHQRSLAVPPERAGRTFAHPDRRPGAAGRIGRRRRAGGDARRLHRL